MLAKLIPYFQTVVRGGNHIFEARVFRRDVLDALALPERLTV